jgi:hypothetical protein
MQKINDAGNYDAAMLLDEPSYSSPAAVRQALQQYTQDTTSTGRTHPLPGIWEALFQGTYAQLSNWAFSDWNELKIPPNQHAIVQELHLPIINISKLPFDCAVIFKPKAGKTAIMYICKTPSVSTQEFWQENAPVGQLISSSVFGT